MVDISIDDACAMPARGGECVITQQQAAGGDAGGGVGGPPAPEMQLGDAEWASSEIRNSEGAPQLAWRFTRDVAADWARRRPFLWHHRVRAGKAAGTREALAAAHMQTITCIECACLVDLQAARTVTTLRAPTAASGAARAGAGRSGSQSGSGGWRRRCSRAAAAWCSGPRAPRGALSSTSCRWPRRARPCSSRWRCSSGRGRAPAPGPHTVGPARAPTPAPRPLASLSWAEGCSTGAQCPRRGARTYSPRLAPAPSPRPAGTSARRTRTPR